MGRERPTFRPTSPRDASFRGRDSNRQFRCTPRRVFISILRGTSTGGDATVGEPRGRDPLSAAAGRPSRIGKDPRSRGDWSVGRSGSESGRLRRARVHRRPGRKRWVPRGRSHRPRVGTDGDVVVDERRRPTRRRRRRAGGGRRTVRTVHENAVVAVVVVVVVVVVTREYGFGPVG